MALPWSEQVKVHQVSEAHPLTRWQHAATVYQRYRQDPEVRATWWKITALLGIGCIGILGVAITRVAHRPTVEPYYVYVTPTGQVLGTEKVAAKPFDMQEELLRKLTQEWIEWVRSIPLDPTILQNNWKKAMAMSTQPVAQRLWAYAKAVDLNTVAKKAEKRELAIKVQVENVLTLSPRVMRVQWRETLYDGANAEKESVGWTAEVEFIIRKPTNQKELDENALGVWVARAVWTKNNS